MDAVGECDPLRFDYGAATGLMAAARAAATLLDAQIAVRNGYAAAAGAEFRGYYASAFERNAGLTAQAARTVSTGLYRLAALAGELEQAAREEDARRAEVREWVYRHRRREQLAAAGVPGVELAEWGDPRPGPGRPPLTCSCAVAVAHREAPVGRGRGEGGMVSARPGDLRAFTARTAAMDAEVADALVRVRSRLEEFGSRCQWGRLDGSAIVTGLQVWLEQNRADSNWLNGVAAGFEAAGGGPVGATVWAVFSPLTNTVTKPTAQELMGLLKRMSAKELQRLLADSPKLAQIFWDTPPDPVQVASWWGGLTINEREKLAKAAPAVIGNLAGVPFGVRDRCNRQVLKDLSKTTVRLTAEQRSTVRAVRNALDKAAKNPRLPGVQVQLVSLHMSGPTPMAALSYGELDTAQTTTWCAPGMGTDASQGLPGWTTAATNLYLQQDRLDPGRSHAVVAWLGYDTPSATPDLSLLEVTRAGQARTGGTRLAAELDGAHATRLQGKSGVPVVSVVAHSYGTTTAADALAGTDYPVDSFTMVGSAGIDSGAVRSLTDLHVKPVDGHPAIYTTAAQADALAPYGAYLSGRPNPNPGAADARGTVITGAESFTSEPVAGMNGVLGHDPLGTGTNQHGFLGSTPPEGHGYFDPNTSSLWNMAATSIGQPDLVVGGLTPTTEIPQKLLVVP